MKLKSKMMRFGFALFAMAVITVGTGCDSGGGEDKDNDPGDPKMISGDSTLRVTVNDDITNIYFDGDYLGTVAPGDTQDYSVPSGTHNVKVTNAEKDNQKPDTMTIDFQKGFVHAVTVSWEKEDNSLF